jgi:hypothetical protein
MKMREKKEMLIKEKRIERLIKIGRRMLIRRMKEKI